MLIFKFMDPDHVDFFKIMDQDHVDFLICGS